MSDRIDLVTVAYPSGLGPIDHPGNRQRVIITLKKKDEEKIKINVAVRSWLRSTGYLVGSGNDYVVWEAKKIVEDALQQYNEWQCSRYTT